VERNEIVAATIFNYLKPIKLLCEMNDINVKWKKITTGLRKERKYAEGRLSLNVVARLFAAFLNVSSLFSSVGLHTIFPWQHTKPWNI
jgi:hypothetical protein